MPGNTKKSRRGNGEGSIYQRSKNQWAAVLTVGTKPDGKPDRKFFYGKTRKEVAEKLRDAQNKLDVGVMPGGDNVTFEVWITYWLENIIKPGVKERTYKNYSSSIYMHIIPGIGKVKLRDLTEEIVQTYLTKQSESGNLKRTIDEETGEPVPSHGPVAPTSIIQQRRHIIAALEYAVDKGKLARNVAKKTKRPKVPKKAMNVLSDEDMEILATKGTKYRYYTAYMLTLTTACRRGEILGIAWKNVDIGMSWSAVDKYFPWKEIRSIKRWDTVALKKVLEESNIKISEYGYVSVLQQMTDETSAATLDTLKTDTSMRNLVITEEMILLLIFWRMQQNEERRKAEGKGKPYNEDNLVFCTRKGTHVIPRNFSKMWSENIKSMGIDHKRFHDLRHTVATVMLEDGEAMNTVQEQLGHYDAGFTASRYGHVTAKMKNRASERLGERLKAARGTATPEESEVPVSDCMEPENGKIAEMKPKTDTTTLSAARKIK